MLDGFIIIRISGKGLQLDEITNKFGVKPTTSYKKGDTHYNKYSKETLVYKDDCWLYDKKIKVNKTFNKKIVEFLEPFLKQADYVHELSKQFEIIAWISLYPEEDHNNIHLSPSVIESLHTLGLSLDIEISDLRMFYDGSYVNDPRYI